MMETCREALDSTHGVHLSPAARRTNAEDLHAACLFAVDCERMGGAGGGRGEGKGRTSL